MQQNTQRRFHIRFNGFGSSDSTYGDGFSEVMQVNTRLDALKGKKELDKVADEWYKKNKPALLSAKEIDILGMSFGGLKAWAYLAAIARDSDNIDACQILSKITKINLIDPLPSCEAESIKPYVYLCVLDFIQRFWPDVERPSIIRYIEEIKAKNHKLPRAEVKHYCANNDEVVKHKADYCLKVTDALCKSELSCIVKKYAYTEYEGKHLSMPTFGVRTQEDKIKYKVDDQGTIGHNIGDRVGITKYSCIIEENALKRAVYQKIRDVIEDEEMSLGFTEEVPMEAMGIQKPKECKSPQTSVSQLSKQIPSNNKKSKTIVGNPYKRQCCVIQ